MLEPGYEAFVFDFDGVLADSVEVKTRAFARLFEPHGEETVGRVVDHHRRHGGMSRFEKFRHYYREYLGRPITAEEEARLSARFSQLVVDEVVAAAEIPGATAFVRAWSKRIPCFVVSGTPMDEIRRIVDRRGMGDCFREVLGTPRSKEEHLRDLIRRYQLEPGRCLFFGDAASDYEAARTCGLDFLGILPSAAAPLLQQHPGIRWVRDFLALGAAPDVGAEAPGTLRGDHPAAHH